ncbi:hypothetical protein OUZ56_003500 [Daphnia magna]|uniref:Uncharacterized protein n=1 Tax=Daphnia magna TaxID=35525 RepID=A0ABR0A8X1_9CRUS|nr:hypothetical protein OUZ56_003500 [Daphnia magna]
MLDNQKCGLTLVIKRITIKEKEEKREEKEKEEEEKEEKKKEGEEMTIEEEDIVIIDVDPDDLIGLYHKRTSTPHSVQNYNFFGTLQKLCTPLSGHKTH